MLIKEPVPTPDCSTPFSADILQAYNGELLIVFHALERYSYSLYFHMINFALLLSYENPINCGVHRILIEKYVIFNKFRALR